MNNYLEEYNRWCTNETVDSDTKLELSKLNDKEIKERFYKELDFGTAGLRGIVAAGPNCMNIYTVRKATQGLCEDILNEGTHLAKSGVAIAYDSRHMSYEFALESAKVLAANGIKVYLFESLRPTPELSFAVRHLGCARGIVITASHNPKQYNGYKAYGKDGGQLPPESADYVVSIIKKMDIFDDVKVLTEDELKKSGLLVVIGKEVDEAYYNSILAQSINEEAIESLGDDFKVIYSPFHGTGNIPVREILKRIGCQNVRVVKEQEKPDGEFPTVKSPNPEDKEGFYLAIQMANEDSADVIFATDPDGDRIGVIVKNSKGEYITLSGNQIGVLLTEFILRNKKQKGELSKKGAIIKTIVTTDMVKSIAQDYGIKVYDVLTGFKFIGEKIKQFEEGEIDNEYIFGFEESYGYLAGTYCRDKDAVLASMLITEMAADYKTKGMTLYDGLMELYKKYGFYIEDLRTYTFEGMDGIEKMKSMMENLRTNPPMEFDGIKVSYIWDVSKNTKTNLSDGSVEELKLPKSNVLKFILEDDSWIAVRPSGTEPKIKFYFASKDKNMDGAKSKLESFMKQMEKLM